MLAGGWGGQGEEWNTLWKWWKKYFTLLYNQLFVGSG